MSTNHDAIEKDQYEKLNARRKGLWTHVIRGRLQ